MSEEIYEKLNAATAAVQEAEAAHKRQIEELMGPVLEALAEQGVRVFRVTGYTPSFNDGDACTHSTYWAFTLDGLVEEDGIEAFENLGFELSEETVAAYEEYNSINVPRSWQPGYTEEAEREASAKQEAAWDRVAETLGISFPPESAHSAIDKAIETVVAPFLTAAHDTNWVANYVYGEDGWDVTVGEYYCGW